MSAATIADRAREKLDARLWPTIERLPEPEAAAAEPFPFDALGPILGPAGSSISNDIQAADALSAGSVLAGASLATQVHADVLLPHGQRAPLSLFVVSGLDSGERKSAVDQVALGPVEDYRREQARRYQEEVRAADGERDSPKPRASCLTIGRATTEGLQHMLSGQPSVGLFTSEGAELFGGHSMREERRSAGLAWMLKAWGAETLDAFPDQQTMTTRSLGSLTLSLIARIGGFERGMDQAERKASRTAAQIARDQKRRAQEVEQAWSKIGVTAGAGLTVAAGMMALWARSSVDAVDGFNDLRDVTGASIENISALDSIARQTGGTFDQVSSTLTKFNGILKDADPSKGPGAVLKALNLDIEELKRLDPAEALRKTAVAMQMFADDGAKARAVQELFGKSVKEVAPFLKDLAEAGELQAKVSTKGAEEIDRFNKELAKTRASVEDLARELSIDLVSGINAVVDRFKTGKEAGKGFFEIGWDRYKENIRGFYEELGLLQKKVTFRPTFSADDQSAAETARLLRQSALPSLQIPDAPEKPSRGLRKDGDADRAAREAQSYLESLQRQLQATQNLSVAETVLADIRAGRLKLTGGVTEEQLVGVAKQIDAAREHSRVMEEQKKAMEAVERMQATIDRNALAEVETLIRGNQALRESIEVLGLEGNERARVEQARLAGTIALKEEELQMLKNSEASATQISALEREIGLLGERSVLIGQMGAREDEIDVMKKAEGFSAELNRGLTQAFADAFRSTDRPLKAFGDSLYNTISARVFAALAEQLATRLLGALGGASGGGLGGMGDFFGALFGGGRASGGPVMPNTLYEVNERGPEMLEMSGRQYLMMGSKPGNVTPLSGAKQGGQPTVVNYSPTFVLSGPVDRRTQEQVAQQAYAGAQRAWARNS